MKRRREVIKWEVESKVAAYPRSLIEKASAKPSEAPVKATRVYKNQPQRSSKPFPKKIVSGKQGDGARGHGVEEEGKVVEEQAVTQLSSTVEDGSECGLLGQADLDHNREGDAADETPTSSSEEFAAYIDSVASGVAGFKYIHGGFCAVQGWDRKRQQSTESWYHLQFRADGEDVDTGCSCPHGSRAVGGSCVHQRYFKEMRLDQRLPRDHNPRNAATLFAQRPVLSVAFLSLFSVDSTSSAALMGRAIVTHQGASRDGGLWKCSKDPGLSSCFHINESKKLLPEEFGDLVEQVGDVEGVTDVCSLARGPGSTVSYLPIRPPKWAKIPSDKELYPIPPLIRDRSPVEFFPLQHDSSCSCAGGRSFYDPQQPTSRRRCKLYTTHSLLNVEIEVQKCPRCPSTRRRFIGPDLRTWGVFNYNNSILVTHELMDEYTSIYTLSETPFIAWVRHVTRRYAEANMVFLGPDLFRSVWFSYVFNQEFVDDMSCQVCGKYPETVIWDGITLAFSKKHIKTTLRPPTTLHPESIVRSNVHYQPHQQLLLDPSLRKSIRDALGGITVANFVESARLETAAAIALETNINTSPSHSPGASTPTAIAGGSELGSRSRSMEGVMPSTPTRPARPSGPRVIDTPVRTPSKELVKKANQVEAQLNRTQSLVDDLTAVCPALGRLFDKLYGQDAYLRGEVSSPEWKSFFKQIAAEESVLQMINFSSWSDIRAFLRDPTPSNRKHLLSVPAFYTASRNSLLPHDDFIAILRWANERARVTLKALLIEPVPLPKASSESLAGIEDDWKKTGILYSMPQYRHRPRYAKLRTDGKPDPGTQLGDRCRKWYAQYGKSGQTGGIMVCWCTHSIAYGFHCIPNSEGRDDVFSAMVTRWPVAPKRVVYDYACALGPYCLLREPQFFGKTFFGVDHFHAAGHTKCSPASFISEHVNVDPSLAGINTSAAECGNGALSRIRKSVSYMGQERAVIYTKVFLSIWNRLKILKIIEDH